MKHHLFRLFLLSLTAGVVSVAHGQNHARSEGYRPSFGKLRDTLYVLDSTYLEVRLDQQMIYQHFRSGRVEKYPCSTGDPRIKDGIATRAGIFTIQGRAQKALSQQFQVYLNYWMQFDGGIGFHGLEGRSYYRYLGNRPSSHGCVRISNETGAQIFRRVTSGTLVYVHSGSPARLLRFGDTSRMTMRLLTAADSDLLSRRLEAVTAGQWADSTLAIALAIPARQKFKKIEIGSVHPRTMVQYQIKPIEMPRPAPVRSVKLSLLRRLPSSLQIPGQEDDGSDDKLSQSDIDR